MRPPVRMGVVGVGSVGIHHARILRDLEDVQMEGFWEIRPERAREVERIVGVQPRSSLDDLLDRIDAAVIAVPTTSHEEVAVATLRRGIHALVEKPIAPSLPAADRILEASRRAGALVLCGHVERFNSAIRGAEKYLEAPLFIESHRLAPFVPRSTDVAVVLDLMIHDVDLAGSLVGRSIEEISATGVPVLTPNVDIANARLTFEGGAVANLTASRVSTDRMRKLRVFQSSGYLSLDLARGTGEFLRLKEALPAIALGPNGARPPSGNGRHGESLEEIVERIPLGADTGEPLARELENFRDAALGRAQPVVPGTTARNVLAVSLAIEERIESHVADQSPA